jgi:hypothetical protein
MVEAHQVHAIVSLIRQAQEVDTSLNLLQPGLVKEMIIADVLGHVVNPSKHQQDALSSDKTEGYEYLTCKDGGTFQLDRMFKSPPEKRQKSLRRITRNKKIYCAVFDKKASLLLKEIWDIPVNTFLNEVERQLDASQNEISHVSVSAKWTKENGTKVYPKKTGRGK